MCANLSTKSRLVMGTVSYHGGDRKSAGPSAEGRRQTGAARRRSRRWRHANSVGADLAPLGTDAEKQFLEVAPWLVVMFRRVASDEGEAVYYMAESAGLAAGFLLAAAHHAGLCTLTHTPSPMKFLGRILGRPDHERPFLLLRLS